VKSGKQQSEIMEIEDIQYEDKRVLIVFADIAEDTGVRVRITKESALDIAEFCKNQGWLKSEEDAA